MRDAAVLTRLSAILRIAEFLERGRNAIVRDVVTDWNDEELQLTLVASEHLAVELWQAERNAVPLMEEAFERRVHLDSVTQPEDWGETSTSWTGRKTCVRRAT